MHNIFLFCTFAKEIYALPLDTMLRILIVTDAFSPDFSPRISFFSKNLSLAGHCVDILTENVEIPFYAIDTGSTQVFSTNYYKTAQTSWARKFEWAVKSLLNLCFDYKSHWFYQQWCKQTQGKTYDIVLCSASNYFPLKNAYKLAKRLQVPWIADVRDLSEQFTHLEYQAHHIPLLSAIFDFSQRIRRNRYLRKANAVVSVSPWHIEFLKKYNQQVSLIYNGYDSNMFYCSNIHTNTFDIIYTGKWLQTAMQDPTPFCQALEMLLKSGQLPIHKVRILWYLSQGKNAMQQFLKAYPLCTSISHFCQRVNYNQVPNLLHQASVVLILSNHIQKKGPHGIITTKFFEALGVQKPIINVVSDRAYLYDIIQQTFAGLSTDQANEVASFLIEKYHEWLQNGYTHQSVNPETIKHYDRAYQCLQLKDLMQQTIEAFHNTQNHKA